jgi:hypothetical protein
MSENVEFIELPESGQKTVFETEEKDKEEVE